MLTDPADSGVNDAVAHGVRKLDSLGASAGVIAPSDIPFVTSAELGIVLAALEQTAVVLTPATRDGGTNILGLSPPDVIAPAFGPDSFARHCALRAQIFSQRSFRSKAPAATSTCRPISPSAPSPRTPSLGRQNPRLPT